MAMKLHLGALEPGRNPVDERLSPERIGLDHDAVAGDVRVTGAVTWREDHAQVRLAVETPGRFVCDRCAEPFSRTIEADVHVVVLMEDPVPGDEDEDGVIYAGPVATVVDLSREISEAVLLAIPMRRLCRPDCRGLCPICYMNLNEATCEHAAADGGSDRDEGDPETDSQR
ncbi:MAG: hypothetical protein MAG453_00704 [Calditrichaeota bacterium]|nr:hypothetical protein [Calditrichota bacterium]